MHTVQGSALLIIAILSLFITIALVLGVRNIVCWYFKIKRLVAQNDEIITLPGQIRDQREEEAMGV